MRHLVASTFMFAISVAGQNNVLSSCFPGASWWQPLNAAAGRDVCSVATEMRSSCNATRGALPANSIDFREQKSACLCSKNVYAVFGACKACQSPGPGPIEMSSYPDWSAVCENDMTGGPTRDFSRIEPDWVHRVEFPAGQFNVNSALGAATVELADPSNSESGPPPSQTSSIAMPTSQARKSSSSNTGVIAGSIVGVFLLLALLAGGAFFWFRRQKKNRVAPSAEFRKYIRSPTYAPDASVQMSMSMEQSTGSGRGYRRVEFDEDAPPIFTPGEYVGPVPEKGGYAAEVHSSTYSSPVALYATTSRQSLPRSSKAR